MDFVRKSAMCATVFCSVLLLSSCSNTGKEGASAQKNVESEETLLKTLSDQQTTLPQNSPQLETPLEKIASIYELQNRYDLAEKYLRQLTVCKVSNWNWERLSLALAEQKKFDEAIEAMKKSVALVEVKNKPDDTAAVYIRYAKLLEQAGRQSDAVPLRTKAHELAPIVKNSTIRWHKQLTPRY